jgi:adenosine 3'-phospho 5'-phosphosulfate transporter B3
MLGGVLILRKRYSLLEYISAGLLSAGLALFTLADVSGRPLFDIRGVLLLVGALAADAFIGNIQEKTLSDYRRSAKEMVLFTYIFGALFSLTYQLGTGELWGGLDYASRNSSLYIWLTGLYSLVSITK